MIGSLRVSNSAFEIQPISTNAEDLLPADSALIERHYSLFAEGVAQLRLGDSTSRGC
jgi:hypothetical protein